MDTGTESGKQFEIDERVEQLTDEQEQVINRILKKVDQGIEDGDMVVSHAETVGIDDFDSTKEAMMVIKRAYEHFDVFPASVGFNYKQTEDGVIEQYLFIDITLQPEE